MGAEPGRKNTKLHIAAVLVTAYCELFIGRFR
jgi:hypothetical protein